MSQTCPSDSLMLVVKRVHLAIRHAFDTAFASYGLTGPQGDILRHVLYQNGLEQRILQERLGVTAATLTGIIDGLVDRGLVERRLSAEDARVRQLFITAAGEAVTNDLAQLSMRLEQRLLAGFSPTEQALLRDWLQRMATNIGASDHDGCC